MRKERASFFGNRCLKRDWYGYASAALCVFWIVCGFALGLGERHDVKKLRQVEAAARKEKGDFKVHRAVGGHPVSAGVAETLDSE